MYKYYCIKIVLEDNTVWYYSGMASGGVDIEGNINDSRFYDKAEQAYESYKKVFAGRTLTFDGLRVLRASVVEVTSNNKI